MWKFTPIHDVARLIAAVGDRITIIVRSEPGCGKTTLLQMLAKRYPTHLPVYIDCPNESDGSLVMDIPDKDEKALLTYLSKRLRLNEGKPVIIMLDEYLKVNKLMKTLFTRLILEREIGDTKLPEGSIVFATSNNSSDGVNDTAQAHEGNRVMFVDMEKPDAKTWGVWAMNNGIDKITRTLVHMKPMLLHSYKTLSPDKLNQNPFIFNPTKPEQSVTFVSPRSLHKADYVIQKRDLLGPELTKTALCGVVGEAAAELFAAFIMMEKDIIPYADVIADPDGVNVPTSIGALVMMLQDGVDCIQTQDELCKFMTFVNRVPNEDFHDMFMFNIMTSERTAAFALQNKRVNEWYQKNHKILPKTN
jgi:hypothetical protein